jgi:hypothetical protein
VVTTCLCGPNRVPEVCFDIRSLQPEVSGER